MFLYFLKAITAPIIIASKNINQDSRENVSIKVENWIIAASVYSFNFEFSDDRSLYVVIGIIMRRNSANAFGKDTASMLKSTKVPNTLVGDKNM